MSAVVPLKAGAARFVAGLLTSSSERSRSFALALYSRAFFNDWDALKVVFQTVLNSEQLTGVPEVRRMCKCICEHHPQFVPAAAALLREWLSAA